MPTANSGAKARCRPASMPSLRIANIRMMIDDEPRPQVSSDARQALPLRRTFPRQPDRPYRFLMGFDGGNIDGLALRGGNIKFDVMCCELGILSEAGRERDKVCQTET